MTNNLPSSGLRQRLTGLRERLKLHGDDEQHEQTDLWSNRDLIPLPPQRRTWGMTCSASLARASSRLQHG